MTNLKELIAKHKLQGVEKDHLKEFAKYLSGFARLNCPESYYRSWKILVMGANEYSKEPTKVNRILNLEINLWLDTKEK